MEFSTMVTNCTTGATEIFNGHNTSTTEDALSATETPVSDENKEVVRLIEVFIRPILFIFGTYGNAVSFYIMRRGSLKKVSTCFYMTMLAIADTRKYELHNIIVGGYLREVSTRFFMVMLAITDTCEYVLHYIM